MNDIKSIDNQIIDLQALVQARLKNKLPLTQLKTRTERLLKMSPRNSTLKKQCKAFEKQLSLIDKDTEDMTALIRRLQDKRKDLLALRIETDIEHDAYKIALELSIPDWDPLVGSQLLSAMYENAQYQFIRVRQIHERMITKLYTRRNDKGEDKGWDVTDPSEVNDSLITRLEEIRTKRDYLTRLRFAIKREFERFLELLPEDAPFTPRLSRRTDEQMEQYLQERKAIRNHNNFTSKQDMARKEIDTWRFNELPKL